MQINKLCFTKISSLQSDEIVNWLRCDEAELGYQLLTDDEIIEIANEDETNAGSETESDAEYDGSENTEDLITAKDLRKDAKDPLLRFCTRHTQPTGKHYAPH